MNFSSTIFLNCLSFNTPIVHVASLDYLAPIERIFIDYFVELINFITTKVSIYRR
jgi:hypothetical protein